MATKKQQSTSSRWYKPVVIIILLMLLVMVISGCASLLLDDTATGNVAIIPVHGAIALGADASIFADTVADADRIAEWIRYANEDEMIEIIVLDINSGGGSPVASAEIARAVADSEKPVIAQIRETGASGAYWIASSADVVFAHELSVTGSIGVIGSYLEFSGFLEDHNVTYNRQVAGQYKDLGSPFKEMTVAERRLYQETLETMHAVFIREVAQSRNLSTEYVGGLATGQIYLGAQAQGLGLVDRLGSRTDVTAYIEEVYAIDVAYVEYSYEPSFLDTLTSLSSDVGRNVGAGIGQTLLVDQSPGIKV